MNRRTRRFAVLTFAAQPWTLFEDDPGAGGGGGGTGTPAVNENGFPDNTPIAQMTPEHQAAYWKYQSRKHEQRANAVDVSELETLRAAAVELAERKAAELTETQRIQAEKDAAEAARATAEAERDAARSEALRIRVAADKGLTSQQAARLQGSTKEELEADADALKSLFAPAASATAPRPPLGGGSDVKPARDVSAGEARYRAQHGTN